MPNQSVGCAEVVSGYLAWSQMLGWRGGGTYEGGASLLRPLCYVVSETGMLPAMNDLGPPQLLPSSYGHGCNSNAVVAARVFTGVHLTISPLHVHTFKRAQPSCPASLRGSAVVSHGVE